MPQLVPFVAGAIGAAAPAIGTAAFGAYVAGAGFASFMTTTIVGKLLTSVAISALATALQDKPGLPPQQGIRTEYTMTGGVNPASFVLGRYATEGQLVAPPMSHGQDGGVPNAYLTYVIDLGDIPGQTLEGLFIDGEPVTLGATAHADYGLPVEGRHQDYAWVKFYDGTQTVADPMLLDKYGSDPDRPWTADMIGTGICYAICTFRRKRDLYSAFPKVRFVMGGIPIYDPRKDTTVGGSGSHRWANPSTWESSTNPTVQVYNIKRGITLPGGDIWGGNASADDLPLSNWFAAMNACDAQIEAETGVFEPTYRSGFEVFVSDEPASVIEELLKAASGQVSEVGGVWKIRIGGPGLPVFFFSDDDINISDSQSFEPFPGIGQTYNGVHATYPDPDALWNSTDAPPRYSAAYEAEDGERRLVADLALPSVPYANQVQRLMVAYLEEERRMRRHSLTLAPSAIPLEPLDSVSWTSARNGYDAKVFEVSASVDPLVRSRPQVALRERDPVDYDWQPNQKLPTSLPSLAVGVPAPYVVQSWAFTAITLKDAGNADRRPALKLTWSGVDDDEVEGVAYEVRLQASGAAVADGVVLTGASGQVVVSAGILPQTQYEARLRLVPSGSRRADWTAWASATTGDVRLAEGDIPASVNQAVVDFNAVAAGFEGTLVDLQVDAEAAQQAALDSDAARLASETARDAAQNARDNAQTAADAAGNSATVAAGSASSAQTSATAAGSSASVSEGQALIATTSAAEAARTAALAGPAILAAPAEQWTDVSAYAYSVLLKPPTPAANLVTGDADFGDAFAYPDTANQTIGQAYPFPWHDAAVYEVRARFKVVDDGTMGALDMRLGGTVQAGVAVLESNNQTGVIAATAADGVVEAVAWFTGRVAAEVSAVSGGVEVKAFTSAVGGDKFYPHLRQNANGNSNGLVRLGALEVRDITAQVDAMLAEAAALGSATAAASSATAASASETAAGTSASAAETARLQAQTAQGAAETARDAAATSQTNAQGSASAAATSATNSATSASAAGNSASAASTSASAAGTSATLAGQHATSASGHADTASIQAGNASTSASAAATSASSASGSAAAASTSASTAAGVLQEINLSATDYQRVITGTAALDAVGSDETASDGGASFGQAGTVISATGSGASFSTTGSTSGLRVEVPMEQAVGFGGGRVRVDILAKPADTNAAAGFTAAYSTSDNGNSGRNDFTLAAGWAWYSFYYDVPVPNSGGTDFVGLWGDSAATGKKTEFARVLIRQAPLAGDIPELGVVQADVTVAQAAVADLEGNALASFVMRAKAGAALGSVEIVAAKDASNGGAAASKVKLTGDEIEFDGMSVFTDDLRSNNYVEGSSGWRIRSNGNIEFNKLIARGDIVNSAVNADLLDSSAVVTDKVAENAISRFYSAFGGSSNKQIAVTNNTGVQVDLLIIAFIRGEHSAIENSTVNVRLYKETVSGGLSNEIGRMEELSTAGGLVKLTGTAIATTTQSNGITRYYRAVGTNCSQIDLVVFQRQK